MVSRNHAEKTPRYRHRKVLKMRQLGGISSKTPLILYLLALTQAEASLSLFRYYCRPIVCMGGSIESRNLLSPPSYPTNSLNHLLPSTNGLPMHATSRTVVMTMTMTHTMSTSRTFRLGHHSPPRTISGIKGSTAPAISLHGAPASLAREDVAVEAVKGAGAGAVDKGRVAHEGDVVETEVPD